jgi:hypothetical protein
MGRQFSDWQIFPIDLNPIPTSLLGQNIDHECRARCAPGSDTPLTTTQSVTPRRTLGGFFAVGNSHSPPAGFVY